MWSTVNKSSFSENALTISKVVVAATVAALLNGVAGLPKNRTDALVNAAIDAGTFQNPSVNVRPRFRYWVPDASVNHTSLADDIKEAGRVGAGGVEVLGFYQYGGKNKQTIGIRYADPR